MTATEVRRPRQRATSARIGSGAALVAAAATLHRIGAKPLWRDEAVSVSVARRPLARIIEILPHHDLNAGVYYGVLHVWLKVFAHVFRPAVAARSLSALCVVIACGVTGAAATRWGGAWFGAACGVLLGVNPFVVFYGQEARPYALALLCGVASLIALVAVLDGAPRWASVYGAVTVALIYVDLFAVLFVAASAGAVFAAARPVPVALRRVWRAVALATLPIAGWMVLFERHQVAWVPRPTLATLGHTFTWMGAGGIGWRIGLVVAAVGTVLLWRRSRAVATTLIATLLAPPLALWAFSVVGPPLYLDRYVLCSTVGFVGLVACAADGLRRRAGRWTGVAVGSGIVVVLAALGVESDVALQHQPFKIDDAPAALAFVRAQNAPGDAIGYAGGGLRTLFEINGVSRVDVTDVALAPGGDTARQHDLYAREVAATDLLGRLGSVTRLWLVTDPMDGGYPANGVWPAARPTVTSEFRPDVTGRFGDVVVTLWTRGTRDR